MVGEDRGSSATIVAGVQPADHMEDLVSTNAEADMRGMGPAVAQGGTTIEETTDEEHGTASHGTEQRHQSSHHIAVQDFASKRSLPQLRHGCRP